MEEIEVFYRSPRRKQKLGTLKFASPKVKKVAPPVTQDQSGSMDVPNEFCGQMDEMLKFLQGGLKAAGIEKESNQEADKEAEDSLTKIRKACADWGIDFTETSKSKFPVRYPHWKWGMEYEELARKPTPETMDWLPLVGKCESCNYTAQTDKPSLLTNCPMCDKPLKITKK